MNRLSLTRLRTALGLRGCTFAILILSSCLRIPAALEAYVSDLPKRGASNGAYSTLEPELRGALILEDAAAACSIDIVNDIEKEKSSACQCTQSSMADWQKNCKGWLSSVSTKVDSPSVRGK